MIPKYVCILHVYICIGIGVRLAFGLVYIQLLSIVSRVSDLLRDSYLLLTSFCYLFLLGLRCKKRYVMHYMRGCIRLSPRLSGELQGC